MFNIKLLRRVGLLTLFFFIWFSISADFSFAQEGDDLLKARKMYQQGDYEGAISILTDFINKLKAIAAQKKNVAEAFYLLAKVYYTVGEDTKVENNLRKVFETYPNFGKEETDLEFKDRVEKVRVGMAGKKIEPYKEGAPLVVDKKAPKEKKVIVKPTKKKKKKFPVILLVVGVAIVGALLYFLVLKKSDSQKDTRFAIQGAWDYNWASTLYGNSGYYSMNFTGSKSSGSFTNQFGDFGTYTVSTNNNVSMIYSNISLVNTGVLTSNSFMSGNWNYGGNYGTWYANKKVLVKTGKKAVRSKPSVQTKTNTKK